MWVTVSAVVLKETDRAFLLSVEGVEHWISKKHCMYKSVYLREMYIKDWLAHKLNFKIATPRQYFKLDELVSNRTLDVEKCISLKNRYSWQIDAFNKLYKLNRFALFMKMRTGKTRVALDMMFNHYLNNVIKKVYWFCPLQSIKTAKNELHISGYHQLPIKFIGLETVSMCGIDRLFDMLKNDGSDYAVIIDESHLIKNSSTVRVKRLSDFVEKASVVGILTGTPITRNIQDLYQQFKFLDWRILSYKNRHAFEVNHLIYSSSIPGLVRDVINVDYLTQRISPFCFEWFKDDCNNIIVNNDVFVRLSDEQHYYYNKVKNTIINRFKSCTNNSHDIYILFSALHGVMSGYLSKSIMRRVFGVDKDLIIENPKLDEISSYVKTINSRVIIWCSRKHELNYLGKIIDNSYIISGDVGVSERDGIIEKFKNDDKGVLIAMVHVARHSLNLSECNNVIYISHVFDYEVRKQSEARTLLPFKKDVVFYTNFVYKNTLDSRVIESYFKKQNIISDFNNKLKENKDLFLNEIKRL